MSVRAFQLETLEGSLFVMKWEPREERHGVQIGLMELIGEAQTQGGEKIRVKGLGCLPEPTGRIVVSDQPLEIQLIEGERVPIYPQETITKVVELALPAP